MEFRYIAPSPALRAIIRNYLIAHFTFEPDQPAPIKPYAPKPEQGITFFVNGRPSAVNPLTGARDTAPAVSIFGQQVMRCDVHLASEFLMFRVHFQPGALFRLLRIPLSEFGAGYCDAEPILGGDAREVRERLAAARSYAEMVTVVESYLLRAVGRAAPDVHPVDRMAAFVTSHPQHRPLDQLASQSGLSRRQFNRRFNERIGLAPKLYSRLVRFHHACRFKAAHPKVAWPIVAIELGYTDYQHMVRDFTQFTNATPTAWLREDSASPEYALRRPGSA